MVHIVTVLHLLTVPLHPQILSSFAVFWSREESQERATTPPEHPVSSQTNKSSPSSVTSQSESDGGKAEAPALQTVQEGLQQGTNSTAENGHANGHDSELQAQLPDGLLDKEAGSGLSQRGSTQAPIGSEAARPGKVSPPVILHFLRLTKRFFRDRPIGTASRSEISCLTEASFDSQPC